MMDYYYTESFTYDLQGNIKTLERWVYSLDGPVSEGLLQRTQYYPSGLPWNEGYSPSEQPYKYGGKEFVEMHGLDEYDSAARWYYPSIMRTTTMDPHCEQYYDTSPYVWCGNNPIRNVDLNGKDWYEADSSDIKWTDYKSQQAMDEAKLVGTYLGEAVVVFNGDVNEHWGTNNTLTGENANPAAITIYGINGKDDIQIYNGMTIPQSESYSTLNSGDYMMYYEDMATSVYGEKGAQTKGIPTAYTYRIQKLSGDKLLEGTRKGTPITMNGVFMHRTDWSGKANRSSKGCLIIDGRQWRNVEKQLQKSSNIYLRIYRR